MLNIHHCITGFFNMTFFTVFSESEVPILTTHQAPTVMKGIDLIIFLNCNSIFAICQFHSIWFNVSFALEPEATEAKPKKDTQKKGIVICIDLKMYFFPPVTLTCKDLKQVITSDLQFQNQLHQKKKTKQLLRRRVRTSLK